MTERRHRKLQSASPATGRVEMQAIVDGGRTEARMGLQALHDWLRHDGHMPTANDVALQLFHPRTIASCFEPWVSPGPGQ